MTMNNDHFHTHDKSAVVVDGIANLKQQLGAALGENKKLKQRNDELEAELAALKESMRWRKCREELPKDTEYVLAFCPYLDSVEKARLLEDGEWRDSNWNFLEVTHWMPLPKAPEE